MTIFVWAVGLACGLSVFAVAQVIVVAIYCRYMIPGPRPAVKRAESCAVLMALRGADAGLRATLLAHLQQEQANFHLHLIVDTQTDPAVDVIRDLPQSWQDNWTLHFLDLNSDTCSLKCLGLSQVVRKLLAGPAPPSFFAFADSDGQVSRDWLCRLLQPLTVAEATAAGRRRVGATTGHRWYTGREAGHPPGPARGAQASGGPRVSWGALIRYFWNLGSLPQMHLYQVVWGGSWAIRQEALRASGLLEAWDRSLFEDTQVAGKLREAGFRVVTAPGLLVRSYEPLAIAAATRWIGRQLLDMRLYHACFPCTAFHACCLAALLSGAIAVGLAALLDRNHQAVAIIVVALSGYQLVYGFVWAWLQATANKCLSQLQFDDRSPADPPGGKVAGGEGGQRGTIGQEVGGQAIAYLSALLLTQVGYPLATFQAMLTRRIQWRGIDYKITGPYEVKRLNYIPVRGSQDQE